VGLFYNMPEPTRGLLTAFCNKTNMHFQVMGKKWRKRKNSSKEGEKCKKVNKGKVRRYTIANHAASAHSC